MEVIKAMLTSVSSDYRVLILLIAFGFGGFLDGMAGFGTAVAIPASMLAGMGINPVSAVGVCLVANFVPSAYGSIGIPLVTTAGIMGTSAVQLATYVALQTAVLGLFCPLLMVVIAGGGTKALKGMLPICFAAGLSYVLAQLGVSYFLGPELAGVTGAICTMGAIIGTVAAFLFHWLYRRCYQRMEQPWALPPYPTLYARREPWPIILTFFLTVAVLLLGSLVR
jgi:lactate permease